MKTNLPKWLGKNPHKFYSDLNRSEQKQVTKEIIQLITTKSAKLNKSRNDAMLENGSIVLGICYCHKDAVFRWFEWDGLTIFFNRNFPKNVELLLGITYRLMCKKYNWIKESDNG